MNENHIIKVLYNERGFYETRSVFRYDYGQILQLEGFPEGMLPASFEMHFDIGNHQSAPVIGQENSVAIPYSCLTECGPITAWLFLHDTENDGETRFMIRIPVKDRAEPTDIEIPPEQQDVITQTIAALNSGVERVEEIKAELPETISEALQEAKDSGEFDGPQGPKGEKGDPGEIPDISGKADKTDTVLLTTLSRGRKADTTVGNNSIAFGYNVEASGLNSAVFGGNSKATQIDTFASGFGTTAAGRFSSAFGDHNIASGQSAFAIGDYNEASGASSSVEGSYNTASGSDSHSEGLGTIASGRDSHSEGRGTIANHRSQHASGQYNIADDSSASENERGNYVEIVGNGTASNARSNARTLDWDGNEWISGSMIVGGTLTIGGTTITEAQLQALLALLATQIAGVL